MYSVCVCVCVCVCVTEAAGLPSGHREGMLWVCVPGEWGQRANVSLWKVQDQVAECVGGTPADESIIERGLWKVWQEHWLRLARIRWSEGEELSLSSRADWQSEAEKGKFLNDWSRSGAPRLVTFKKTLQRKSFFPLWVCKYAVSLVFSIIKWDEWCLLAHRLVCGIKWAWNLERTWCCDLFTEGFW